MKLFKYIIVACLLFSTSACNEDKLNEKPLDFYSPENSFTTPKGIESALMYNYARLRDYYNGTEPQCDEHTGTDLCWSARNPAFDMLGDYRTKMTPDVYVVSWNWNTMYRIIFDANVVIGRIEAVKYTNESEKTLHIAEARFMRGYAYRILAYLYGGVPIVLEELTAPKTDFVRATKEETLDQAISDLEFAAANLPSVVNVAAQGRVNNAAALQLLADLYISKGEFSKAITATNTIINDPNISLMTTRFGRRAGDVGDPYWDLFQRWNQNRGSSGNKEGIWVLQVEYNIPGGYSPVDALVGLQYERWYGPLYWFKLDPDGQKICLGATTQQGGRAVGLVRPTSYFTHTIWSDGGNWNIDVRNNERNIKRVWDVDNPTSAWFGKKTSDFPQSWFDGLTDLDTMRDFYPLVTKITTMNDHPAVDIADAATGLMSGNAQLTRTDWYFMRVAETYLLRAEAKLANGDVPGATDDINIIRNRAGAIPVTSDKVNIDYILDERMRELNYEENRRITLARLGLLYARTVKGNPFSGATIQPFNNLMPIPFSEIERNTSAVLEQNPGYK